MQCHKDVTPPILSMGSGVDQVTRYIPQVEKAREKLHVQRQIHMYTTSHIEEFKEAYHSKFEGNKLGAVCVFFQSFTAC